eukprot:g2911.t1
MLSSFRCSSGLWKSYFSLSKRNLRIFPSRFSTELGSNDSKRKSSSSSSTWLERVKAAGAGSSPPSTSLQNIALSGLGCFAGIGSLSFLHYGMTLGSDYTLIIGSMGASAVLVFAAPSAPFSQPRNVIGGHILSAIIGVAVSKTLIGSYPIVAYPTTVAMAVMAMQLTKTTHPPAGGTSLIALMGAGKVGGLGFALTCPIALTTSLLVCSGICFNNMFSDPERRYPTYWW